MKYPYKPFLLLLIVFCSSNNVVEYEIEITDKYNEEETHFLTCNNPYFQMISRAINKNIDIEDEYNLNEHDRKDIYWPTLKHIYINLQEYKKKNSHYQYRYGIGLALRIFLRRLTSLIQKGIKIQKQIK